MSVKEVADGGRHVRAAIPLDDQERRVGRDVAQLALGGEVVAEARKPRSPSPALGRYVHGPPPLLLAVAPIFQIKNSTYVKVAQQQLKQPIGEEEGIKNDPG
jgi:hypothetical protein